MLVKPKEKIVLKDVKVKEKNKKINLDGLNSFEKSAIKLIYDEGGLYFRLILRKNLILEKLKLLVYLIN